MELTLATTNRIKKILHSPLTASDNDRLFLFLQYNKLNEERISGIHDKAPYAKAINFFRLYLGLDKPKKVNPTGSPSVEIITRGSFEKRVMDELALNETATKDKPVKAKRKYTRRKSNADA